MPAASATRSRLSPSQPPSLRTATAAVSTAGSTPGTGSRSSGSAARRRRLMTGIVWLVDAERPSRNRLADFVLPTGPDVFHPPGGAGFGQFGDPNAVAFDIAGDPPPRRATER